MNSSIIAVIILILVLIIRNYLIVKDRLRNGMNELAKIRSMDCTTITSSVCNDLLLQPGTYPPIYKRPLLNFDYDASMYAMRAIFRFVTSIDTSNNELMNIDGMSKPTMIYYKNDNQPIAGTWITTDKQYALVVIRGTRNIEELKSDFRYSTTGIYMNDSNYKVHSGMYAIYNSIRNDLLNSVQNVQNVFIVGHSLGSAISYYFGLELLSNHNVEIVAFAPPRSGDRNFANVISKNLRISSIINNADFIPSIPWSFMPEIRKPYTPDEYSHVSPVYIFNNMQNDIGSCHGLFAYYQGINSSPVLIPQIS